MIQRSGDLREAYQRLSMVVDAATDAFVGMNAKGQVADWNRQAEAIFGWSSAEVLGRDLAETIIPLQHREGHRAGLARFLATGKANILNRRVELVAVDRSGREFPIELSVGVVGAGTDEAVFHAFVRDISERRAYQDALRRSDAEHHLLADQLAEAQRTARLGSWEWKIAADRITWSEELSHIFGVEPDGFVATYQSYLDHIHPEDRALAQASIGAAFESGSEFTFDHRIVRGDGAIVWIQSRGHVEIDAEGLPVRMSVTAANVTERVALQQELTALALFDELTGLHNRRGFVTLADHQLQVAGRSGRPVPLLFIDIDGMKTINDTYGHNEGDRALGEVAKFLGTAVRASDLVARIGGDEFCILLVDDGSADRTDVERVMANLRSGPSQGQRPYPLTLSLGVAWLEAGSGTSVDDLMGLADRAMYQDKSSQRGRAHSVDAEAAHERDHAGQERDQTADRRDQVGQERDETAEKRDHAGHQRDEAADRRDETGWQRDHAAEKRDQAGHQRDEIALVRDQTGRDRDRAADKRDLTDEQSEASLGEAISRVALDRSSLARRQAASDRKGASEDRRFGADERMRSGYDRTRASADRGAGAEERTEAENDRTNASADRKAGADERSEAGSDRTSASADRGAGADERTEAQHDRKKGRRRV